ncbi:aldehyde dehydrogenase family protein [Bordetella pertussis]|uniref:aldehyde dehydrogenase family protein n=1 Tax=Bordetella pertussis TaxID=520 RepID=UPI0028E52AAC|nr:aldehyde dehydrogenase family protein [Bordetella pertussis]WNQ38126.1 aldehyde dehydrogenase family protein [Bordetella pertussis]
MQAALTAAREQGGQVSGGERLLAERYPDAWYVRPAIVEMPGQTDVVCHETFAPILYVMRYGDLPAALGHAQRRAARPVVRHLHQRPARSRGVPVVRRVGLRHRPT